MSTRLNRRQFSSSLFAASGASLLGAAGAGLIGGSRAGAAPPGSSEPKVPKNPLPPVTISVIPEAFEDRYADLGGMLDLTNGVVWGYEVAPAIRSGALSYNDIAGIETELYLEGLAYRELIAPTAEEAAIFAETLAIAEQRTWRLPSVFEARAAVEKGLFTFGPGGMDAYYASPVNAEPGVSYGLFNLRWTGSVIPNGKVHLWSPGDGGTLVLGKGSYTWAILVSKL